MVSEPTTRVLLQGVQIVLLVSKLHPGDYLLGVHSFLRFPNLDLRDYPPGV